MRIEPDHSTPKELDYVASLNRAIDHIVGNLDQPLPLEEIAAVAGFSAFHFHRIFRSLLGETLHAFTQRLRLERALALLSHGSDQSLTDIALACGFSSSSDFSRSFKRRYGVPPSVFDVDRFRAERRAEWEVIAARGCEARHLGGLPAGENPDGFEVRLRQLPARCVAYLRVHDSYRPGAVRRATERLVAWAEARSLADGQWLGYMWDDPEIVAAEKCRYDVGLEVPDLKPDGEIGRMDFPAMLVAEVEVRGGLDVVMRALEWLFRTWLPRSPYVPDGQPCFEAWVGRPFQHGDAYFEIAAQLPVTR